jgi:hypothetical protein
MSAREALRLGNREQRKKAMLEFVGRRKARSEQSDSVEEVRSLRGGRRIEKKQERWPSLWIPMFSSRCLASRRNRKHYR